MHAFGCDVNATVWALGASCGGDRLAGVTSDGRLEVVAEEYVYVTKKRASTQFCGTGVVQLSICHDAPLSSEGSGVSATDPVVNAPGSSLADSPENAQGVEDGMAQEPNETGAARTGTALVVRAACADATPTSSATSEAPRVVHVALGSAARQAQPALSSQCPPAQQSLRCVAWSPDEHQEEWIATGGSAGLVLIVPAPHTST